MSKKTNNGVARRTIKCSKTQYNSIDKLRAVAFSVNDDDIELVQAPESVVSKLE